MDLFEIRRVRTRQLLTLCKASQADLADATGLSDNYVSRMLSATTKQRKNIGEDTARLIELKYHRPKYWLDSLEDPKDGMGHQTFHGINLTPEGARLGQEWEKLDEPFRTQIQQLIESTVASQIRKMRALKKSQNDEKGLPSG